MNLNLLKTPLTIENIDFRVSHIMKYKDGTVNCYLLAYKDARVDMNILDEACGIGYWQNEYKRDSQGVLQCGIGIYFDDLKQWVWKWSNGVESNTEAVKGEYSDAFKRAGFMWGIGRQLYDFPGISIPLRDGEYYLDSNKKEKVSGYFRPNSWTWEISTDYKTVTAFDGKTLRFTTDNKKAREVTAKPEPKMDLTEIQFEVDGISSIDELETYWNSKPDLQNNKEFINIIAFKKECL